MNKDESLALYAKGRRAWNDWAEKMLAERAELKKSGRWVEGNEATASWGENVIANFFGHEFKDTANFGGFVFPGRAEFSYAKFFHGVDLDNATFLDSAQFVQTTISGYAKFSKATFSGDAWFYQTIFSNNAWFDSAIFSHQARFDTAVFKGYTVFADVKFENETNFIAIRGETFFTLQDATFHRVPDFGQAHFTEAPQFDNATFPLKPPKSDKKDLSARWRALKRLAIQGHDHERERFFFAEEIKALRDVRDKPWPGRHEEKWGWPGGGRYWGGWFYQIFSDFGRSMLRPVLGWVGAAFVSTLFYLSDFAAGPGNGPVVCRAGQGEPFFAALYLAIHKGSIVAGLGGSEKLEQVYACLYGTFGGERYLPVIPDAVVYTGLIQTLFSAVMIFLFLLAVRNHFRIK